MSIKFLAALALAGLAIISLDAIASANNQVMERSNGVKASAISPGYTGANELLAEADVGSGKPCQAMEDMDEQEMGQEAGDTALEGTEWLLVEMNGGPVNMPEGAAGPSLMLDAAGNKATGYAGCNRFFSNYELDGDDLKFGPVGATRKFCEGVQGEIEMGFMKALELVRSWKIEDGSLTLSDGSAVLLRFKQSGSSSDSGGE